MEDRELLELAALAAGIGGGWDIPRGRGVPVCYRRDGGKTWNPLTDDGDALRLAVRCAQLYGWKTFMRRWLVAMMTQGGSLQDQTLATRRAIVRAAAELGRTK